MQRSNPKTFLNEEWREIAGYEGHYEISNHGRVKSLGRKWNCFGKNTCTLPERIMVTFIHINEYRVVWLRKDGKKAKFFVHVLVARAFIPNPDLKAVVNHIDCDKGNSHVSNLEWMSFSENTAYYYKKKKEQEAADIPF